MKTLLSSLITLAVASSGAWATAQFPDILIYKGEKHSMHSNPMNDYFKKHPEKKPKGGVSSTALWRGYLATFEFKEKNLVLKDIQIEVWDRKDEDSRWKSVRSDLVANNEDLIIDWYTGLLVLPHGELVKYVHMGYQSSYSNYILLEVKNGKLIEERNFTLKEFQEFKSKQFEAFKKTEAYEKAVEDYMQGKVEHDKIDTYIQNSILYHTKEFLVE